METVIQTQDLTKKFGDFTAVDGVTFEVRAGEVLGYLGPNGSGKTTMMEMLITFADAAKYFEAKGISVVRGRTGEFLTVQEAAGYQMIACKLDDEIRELWDAPCDTPFFTVA